jgi:predicted TIM-barrel fold metal-dependent hydrolase
MHAPSLSKLLRRGARLTAAALTVAPLAAAVSAQDISFRDYDPPSTLKVQEHPRTRAKYPFIDIHNHQPDMPTQDLAPLVAAMDKLNMAVMNNLSGRGFRDLKDASGRDIGFGVNPGDYLARAIANVTKNAPGRFTVFTNVEFEGIGTAGWTERAVKQLEEDVRAGAAGLKIYKNLGMDVKDASGKRVPVDDPRLDPIWEKCGELHIPVLIHTADPFQFWQPKDKNNERLYELMEIPGRYRDPARNPSFEQLLTEQHNMFRKHPRTQFIDAHLGWLGNDLGRLGKLFDELPNVHTEIGAVLAELGRQPRTAREFFIKYQDRILMGKDSWEPSEYFTYFRVLETADEYFPYYRRRHAFWKMYGLDLPDDVLKKVYYKNALRLLPMIEKSRFPD